MENRIAIVGMACRYPDAKSPAELWENVLAKRRAFRSIPPERLRAEDYVSADRSAPDRAYVAQAAVIEGYEFDRTRFRVVGSTFRSADLAHWLALDMAAQAFEDAGFHEGDGLPRETTGVVIGNTLTGEFSRANVMRLRWPYVHRVVDSALLGEEWPAERRREFLAGLEELYKSPFPPVGEETLAGGLSNTIAGRICNYFDLQGGGYTVDGACAASLLAVATACSSLTCGDVDVALAGGVDLSLDPFEIVGFAKTGALAPEEMRVYDALSAGFWPGEGCGCLVLMRQEDALAQARRVYAVIRGWGVSSDGSGGITRPEVAGQLLALRRAYRRAGFGPETVAYFEGHGTGTSVGDAVELQAISQARRDSGAEAPAVVGALKANIGHTKAAAGVAGLIKATMAVHTQVVPPNTGCNTPNSALTGERPMLRVRTEGRPWPADMPLRAAASAMGFGGINTHVVIEGGAAARRTVLTRQERTLLDSYQDAELFLLEAAGRDEMLCKVDHLLTFAARLSLAELSDLAATLAAAPAETSSEPVRAAVIATRPAELSDRLRDLRERLSHGASTVESQTDVFLGTAAIPRRIGLLFPGQGSPAHLEGGAWRRRFQSVRDLYAASDLPAGGSTIATEVAQPAIVTASCAALSVLSVVGIEAAAAIGHSLGELTALHWAGAYDEEALLRIARTRGKAMAELGAPTGAMASIAVSAQEAEALAQGEPVVVAGLNAPHQTVVSGPASAIQMVVHRAQARGIRAVTLPVSHAFHSPLVAAAQPALRERLDHEDIRPLRHKVFSTIAGAELRPDADVRDLLCRQVTSPVRFTEAVSAARDIDLWIEAGPGQVLTGLMAESCGAPVIPTDAGGPSLRGLLRAVGAAFAMGAPIERATLFADRFTRPFDLDWKPRFFANPCERAPLPDSADGVIASVHAEQSPTTEASNAMAAETTSATAPVAGESSLDLVRRLVAERAELPVAGIRDGCRLLSDLHLNSISVGQIISSAARQLGLTPLAAHGEFADATVAEAAQALDELARTGSAAPTQARDRHPAGVDTWVRSFVVELVEKPMSRTTGDAKPAEWRCLSAPDDPLAAVLPEALQNVGRGGVVVCLPEKADASCVEVLLEGVRALRENTGERTFLLVQRGGGAASFARTLHLEMPDITVCVVDVPANHPRAAEWAAAEAITSGYVEAHYTDAGVRREPVLRLLALPEDASNALPLDQEDVLLVTGGGKGIAAECALSLARESGARLALIGRSRPETDPELAANLERLAAYGVTARYYSADVSDPDAVRNAVIGAQKELGPVTAFLHGAGSNEPKLLGALEAADFHRTLGPKVDGAGNVLAVLDPAQLRLFVGFGSIIARAGLPGEADYALANEWLTRLIEEWAVERPHCRCLSVEWSVWSGLGMGERLGRIAALEREGITAIPPDEGVRWLRRLLAAPTPSAVVVAGRYGNPPTLKQERADLPFLRFLEEPRVHYPGIELVVDAHLSAENDPYLEDHVLRGERLLPAVLGLEAMAQAAMAVFGSKVPPRFEGVEFERPVVVPDKGQVTIRIAALVRESGRVEVVLRSAETGFAVDHFRATCVFGAGTTELPTALPVPDRQEALPLDPGRDLYGDILFQSGRFQRVRGYRLLRATECIAELKPPEGGPWFGRYLPAELILGDPGTRDASIHAIQACIPHATLIPTAIDRFVPGVAPPDGPLFVHARERSHEGVQFTYDVEVTDESGRVIERMEGLHLRAVGERAPAAAWPAPLLAPYLERKLADLLPGAAVTVAVERNGAPDRRARSDGAMHMAIGDRAVVYRRPDGKPEMPHGQAVSASHAGDLTLAITGRGDLGCDIEAVMERPAEVWQDLLGSERMALADLISRERSEPLGTAATRVWCAAESLKKAGALPQAPLTLAQAEEEGWVVLTSGRFRLATYVSSVLDAAAPLAVAVVTEV
jgi:enediyne polyketide synthase